MIAPFLSGRLRKDPIDGEREAFDRPKPEIRAGLVKSGPTRGVIPWGLSFREGGNETLARRAFGAGGRGDLDRARSDPRHAGEEGKRSFRDSCRITGDASRGSLAFVHGPERDQEGSPGSK